MMHNWNEQLDGLLGIIETMRKRTDHRELIAIAGPPGSGKTTLAKTLSNRLAHCSYLSMDGFHLDNRILVQKGLRERKGAPETFDVNGFMHLLKRLKKKKKFTSLTSTDRPSGPSIAHIRYQTTMTW